LWWIVAASGRRKSEEPPLFLPIVRQIPGKHDEGIVMSGWRPLIKGYFAAVRLIVGAVMSSACRCGS
jgi:hypothetical protein